MIGEHAVVLGGSMGGLLAARVLADRFARVTVVERDPLPKESAQRRGVPQGRHAHAVLPAGAQVFDDLFPGLLDGFVADGVPVVREPAEMHFAPGGHKLTQDGHYAVPTPTYQPSRPFLEGHIRARLRELANVEIVDQCEVVDLVGSADRRRVTGVRVSHRVGREEQVLDADLVVDATGRSGRATTWLEAMGYRKPAEERIAVDIKYVSRQLRLRPGAMGRQKVVIVGAEPGRPTGATFLEQEEDRWLLTLIGYRGHHPPVEPDRFLEFARTILPAHAHAALDGAEPVDDLAVHRYRASVRRRYERLERFPEGLLVFGDAMCSFNPAYGQGMSAAALQATALRDTLAKGGEQLAKRFFRTAARRIEVAWQMAVGADLALPEIDAPRTRSTRLVNAYLGWLLDTAEHDWTVAERFIRVSSLLAPPTTLLGPGTLGRVALSGLRRRQRTGRTSDRNPSATQLTEEAR